MKRVYAAIDFLVIPSLTEGLPYVMLEAMACGVPVVATSVGDIPLLVRDRVTGCLVAPGDAPAIFRRMKDLIVDREAARAMARAGRKLVLKSFSAATMAARTGGLYLSLLEG
jgi:glycosyltransferase involved in cell wall biosynthesis